MTTTCAYCKKEIHGLVQDSIVIGDYKAPRLYFCPGTNCRKNFVLGLTSTEISPNAKVGDIVICDRNGQGEVTCVAQVAVVRDGFTNWGKPATFVSVNNFWDKNPNYRNGGGTFTFKRELAAI